MAKLGWRPSLKRYGSAWIVDVIHTTFRNRPPGIYKPGAEQRVIESAVDWYFCGRFTTHKQFADWVTDEIKREEI